jgi:hypothetical protein
MRYLFILAFVALSSPAVAHSGNDLLQSCEAVETRKGCEGYIFGVYRATPVKICPSDQVDSIQMRDVVVKFLRGNPETRHVDSVTTILDALTSAFPCND